MAAVRQPGQRLPADRRRHRPDLCARGRRCRAHDQSPGDREQRRRLGHARRARRATAGCFAAGTTANSAPPTITGSAQQGQTLTEVHGSWTNSPTAFAYQWQQCDSSGANCVADRRRDQPELCAGGRRRRAHAQGPGDRQQRRRREQPGELQRHGGRVPPPPANTAPPTITGTAQQGQTLTEVHGSWTNEPDQLRLPVAAVRQPGRTAACRSPAPPARPMCPWPATSATRSGSPRPPATPAAAAPRPPSAATATVSAPSEAATLGTTTVGGLVDSFTAGRKRVNRYVLPVAGTVTKLSIYLAPTGKAGQQEMQGIIYSDASGKPKTLLAVSEELTYASTEAAGWHDLTLASPLKLATGSYWIGVITGPAANVAGFRYESVPESRDRRPPPPRPPRRCRGPRAGRRARSARARHVPAGAHRPGLRPRVGTRRPQARCTPCSATTRATARRWPASTVPTRRRPQTITLSSSPPARSSTTRRSPSRSRRRSSGRSGAS